MDDDLKRELNFLIAKMLHADFPDIFDAFIARCQEGGKFPPSVFSRNPSFSHLSNAALPGIPDDQLFRLVKMACARSQAPSLLFNPPGPGRPLSVADSLLHNLVPARSFFERFGPDVRIVGHYDVCFCLAMDATSQILITGSDDCHVKLWRFTGEISLMHTLYEHENVVSDIQVHPSNTMFATSSHDGRVCVIDMKTGDLIQQLQLPSEVHTIRFSPDGKFLAAALEEGSVRIFDVPEFTEFFSMAIPSRKSADWLAFSNGGDFLAVTAEPEDLVVLSLKTMQIMKLTAHSELPDFVAFARKTCNLMMSCSYKEKCVKVWRSGEKCWDSHSNLSLKIPNSTMPKMRVVRASFNCDDSLVIAISTNSIFCWSTETGDAVAYCVHNMFTEHLSVMAVHPYMPEVVFVGCQNGRASIWDVKKAEIIVALQLDETHGIKEAIWSPDGQAVIAADERGGFTTFRRCEGKYMTNELFFLRDLDEMHDPNDHTIVDLQREPLEVQPPLVKLEDLRTEIVAPVVSGVTLDDEFVMLDTKWRVSDVVDVQAFVPDVPKSEEEEGHEDQLFSDLSGHAIRSTRRHRLTYSDTSSGLVSSSSASDTDSFSSDSDRPPAPVRSRSRPRLRVDEPRPVRGGRRPPPAPPREIVTITGRRSVSTRAFSPPRPVQTKSRPKPRPRVVTESSESEEQVRDVEDEPTSRSGRILRRRLIETSSEDEVPRRKTEASERQSKKRRELTPPRSINAAAPPRKNRRSIFDPPVETEARPTMSRSGRELKKRKLSDSDEERPVKKPAPKPKPEVEKTPKQEQKTGSGRVVRKPQFSSDEEKPTKQEKKTGSGRVIRQPQFSSDEEKPPVKKAPAKPNKKPEKKEKIVKTMSGRIVSRRKFDSD